MLFLRRYTAQRTMLEQGLLQWGCELLGKGTSGYILEYTTALLLNLCTAPEGRRALKDVPQALEVLSALVGHPHPQVRTFTNATIYVLCGTNSMRATARDVGLVNKLKALKTTDADEAMQVRH